MKGYLMWLQAMLSLEYGYRMGPVMGGFTVMAIAI